MTSQLSLFDTPVAGRHLPARNLPAEVPPLSRDQTVDALLAANAPVAIGVSGGKDSTVAAYSVVTYLRAIGHTGPVCLIHADLGRAEWKQSSHICQQLADRLGVPLYVVQREKGDLVERWQSRWDANCRRYGELLCMKVILPWSTAGMRFCTSELKSAIIARKLVSLFPGQVILSVAGIRRQESANRAKMPVSKENTRLNHKSSATRGFDWNAIIDVTEHQVWQLHYAHDLPIHEAYTVYGTSRVSCAFCMLARDSDLLAASSCPDHVDLYQTLVELECRSGFAFKEDGWLGDIAPHLLSADHRHSLQVAKQKAIQRRLLEAQIPPQLLYQKGWPMGLPTLAQATLLYQIRTQIITLLQSPTGSLPGNLINDSYPGPEAIINRFGELMDHQANKTVKHVKDQPDFPIRVEELPFAAS